MTISIVSRVALSHALFRLLPSLDRRESSLNDEPDHACAMDIAAEPGLALGVRLFWATLLAMLLVVVLPIMLDAWLGASTAFRCCSRDNNPSHHFYRACRGASAVDHIAGTAQSAAARAGTAE
jgi:hypothetical protein